MLKRNLPYRLKTNNRHVVISSASAVAITRVNRSWPLLRSEQPHHRALSNALLTASSVTYTACLYKEYFAWYLGADMRFAAFWLAGGATFVAGGAVAFRFVAGAGR